MPRGDGESASIWLAATTVALLSDECWYPLNSHFTPARFQSERNPLGMPKIKIKFEMKFSKETWLLRRSDSKKRGKGLECLRNKTALEPARAGGLTLCTHQGFESSSVDRPRYNGVGHWFFFQNQLGQIEREPVGIVKLERYVAWNGQIHSLGRRGPTTSKD